MPSGCAADGPRNVSVFGQDRRRVVRRPEDRDDGDDHQQREVDERREREAVAAQSAEAVTPETDLGPGDGAARIFLFEDGSCDCGHQYLILGSTTVYSRSTMRLAMPISSAYTVNTATVTL